jgi:DNA-binding transcriptional MerR regulator
VSSYTIGEVADRSGFSASALRYYEGIGLVAPASRTDAGYRIYDDHTLDRLAFIHRAKQLGCTLEEISDLVGLWDGERCGPVQRRLHELVTAKLIDAQHHIGELAAFTAQLHAAAAQLSGEPMDGPCGESCACTSGQVASSPTMPVVPAAQPDHPPIACTLDGAAIRDRLVEWQALLGQARSRTSAADGALRIELTDDVALGELCRLVAAEQQCCAFFSFAITVDRRGIALEVRAPDGATDAVAALFGHPEADPTSLNTAVRSLLCGERT